MNKWALLIIILISTSLIYAQDTLSTHTLKDKTFQDERISISLGGFLINLDSEMSIASETFGFGIILNFEDALGVQTTSTVLRGELKYTYGNDNKHSLLFLYFGILRKANKTLNYDLEFGNTIIPLGTEISSKFNIHILKGSYNYSFYKDDRVKLAVSGGLYIMPINYSINSLTLLGESDSFIAPLPVVGLHTSFVITSKIIFVQEIDFFYASFENYKGSLTDFNVAVEYLPFTHLSFGLGINSFNFTLKATEEDSKFFNFEGIMKTSYTGIAFYAKLFF